MVIAALCFIPGAVPGWGAPPPVPPTLAEVGPLVVTRTPTAVGGGDCAAFDRAEIVRVDADGSLTVLSRGFESAADPAVSHDGRRLLFAGRRGAAEAWQIWELDLESGAARPITREALDCRSPLYLSRLFTLDSPEPWATMLYVGAEATWNEAGTDRIRSLFNVKLDGQERRRVTVNPADDLDPFQAWDGRILYSSRHFGPGGADSRLFAVNLDGTDYARYGAEAGRRFQRMPCMAGNGLVVFVESDEPTPDGAGLLAAVDEARPHRTYRTIPGEPGWLYLHPAPWMASGLLVSRRPAGGGPARLVGRDLDTAAETVLLDDPAWHWVQAQPLRGRSRPDGRSTVVNLDYTTGVLFGLNCYDADERFGASLAPGTIRRLRVIEGVPADGDRPAPLGRRLLGEVPVEADGSFNIEVPADVPIELQTVDEDGLALATCGWIWVKQRENRGCIGCHEDPERTPENLFVKAVQRPPVRLTLPPERRREVSFRDTILPILEKRCSGVECHSGSDAGWQLGSGPGTARKTFRSLAGRSELSRPARTSRLAWHLFGRDPRRSWDSARSMPAPVIKRMPPAEAAPLEAGERRRIIEWLDLGAPYGAGDEGD